MPFTPSSQTRAPAMTSPDPAVIRALAAALVQRPRSNLADLARSAGISRATLYRMAPTRDEIIELLTAEGLRMMEAALSRGENEPAGPRAALDAMTALMLENRDLFLFVFNLFGEAGGPQDDAYYLPPEWRALEDRFDAFFLRGQRLGEFRIELPAAWLSDFYWSCLYGAAYAIARGRMAPAGAQGAIMTSFLAGAAVMKE